MVHIIMFISSSFFYYLEGCDQLEELTSRFLVALSWTSYERVSPRPSTVRFQILNSLLCTLASVRLVLHFKALRMHLDKEGGRFIDLTSSLTNHSDSSKAIVIESIIPIEKKFSRLGNPV